MEKFLIQTSKVQNLTIKYLNSTIETFTYSILSNSKNKPNWNQKAKWSLLNHFNFEINIGPLGKWEMELTSFDSCRQHEMQSRRATTRITHAQWWRSHLKRNMAALELNWPCNYLRFIWFMWFNSFIYVSFASFVIDMISKKATQTAFV